MYGKFALYIKGKLEEWKTPSYQTNIITDFAFPGFRKSQLHGINNHKIYQKNKHTFLHSTQLDFT